jgi:hypothetical protein
MRKTISTYQNVKNANNREKVGEAGQKKATHKSGEKTYSGCGKV